MSFPPVSKSKTMSVSSSLDPLSCCFHYLVEDLIIEILSRLPVRSLFRFTIVCKAWQALIENNPIFISKHLKQNPTNLNSTCLSLSYTTIYEDPLGISPTRHNYAMSLHSSSGNAALDDTIGFPFLLDQIDGFVIIGVCNGLVCISLSMFEFSLVICNPSTRRFANVPHFDALEPYCLENGEAAYGFAFDSSSDDYKIITPYTTDTKLNEKVGVYTMSTNSWREIVIDVPIDVDIWMNEFSISPPALVDGVFYWGCYKHPSYINAFVLSFNMIDESFGLISGPDGFNGVWGDANWKCVQLKEELAIFAFTSERSFDVWTLNPDLVSWKLKYAIGTMPVVAMPTGGVEEVGDITLVGSGENGDVIYKDCTSSDVQLFFYDLDSREIKRLPYIEGGCQVIGYTESLIPVKKNEF